MNNIFTLKNIKIFLTVLVLLSVSLMGYYGYNEYTYQKITTYVAEGKYDLAENHMETVSPNYRDLRKIKSLIATIRTVEAGDAGDMERVYSRLESFKGFENENINQIYNSLLFSLYKDLHVGNINSASVSMNQNYVTVISDTTVETSATYTQETLESYHSQVFSSAQTETQTTIITTASSTTSQAISSSTAAVTSQTSYTTTVPQTTIPPTLQTTTYVETTQEYIPATTRIVTTTQKPTTTSTTLPYHSTGTVYYVESGEVYHIDPECRTLARSTNVMSGQIPEGRRACKVCSQ